MKTLVLAVLLAVMGCAPQPPMPETPVDPATTTHDDELRAACGKHEVSFTNRATGLPGYVRTDGTYYSTTKVGMLSGAHLAVTGSWKIRGGKLWLTAILPPEAGSQPRYFPPFPLRVDADGNCKVAIEYSWHPF